MARIVLAGVIRWRSERTALGWKARPTTCLRPFATGAIRQGAAATGQVPAGVLGHGLGTDALQVGSQLQPSVRVKTVDDFVDRPAPGQGPHGGGSQPPSPSPRRRPPGCQHPRRLQGLPVRGDLLGPGQPLVVGSTSGARRHTIPPTGRGGPGRDVASTTGPEAVRTLGMCDGDKRARRRWNRPGAPFRKVRLRRVMATAGMLRGNEGPMDQRLYNIYGKRDVHLDTPGAIFSPDDAQRETHTPVMILDQIAGRTRAGQAGAQGDPMHQLQGGLSPGARSLPVLSSGLLPDRLDVLEHARDRPRRQPPLLGDLLEREAKQETVLGDLA
jgi:hypothetical protein